MRRFVMFVRFSGMRPGEVRKLLWVHVDLDNLCISFADHKTAHRTQAPRRIPLNTVIVKLLMAQRKVTPPESKHVFVNAYGRPWTTKALTKNFRTIRQRAGVPDDVRLHGGRHTFATQAVVNGVDVATLAQLLGHANIRTTERYMHLAGQVDHLREAMERAISERNSKEK